MNVACDACVFEKVAQVQFENLGDGLQEVKARVKSLEELIGRGVLLLIANLIGVVVTLAHQLI